MSRAVGLDANLARLEERSRHVQINDESLCDSCHARLGTKLFAMYPDDTIVCYKVCILSSHKLKKFDHIVDPNLMFLLLLSVVLQTAG